MYIFINRDLEIRLSEDSNQYKQFWKQICKFGEYVNPNGNGKMILDKKFADEMVGNFKSGKYHLLACFRKGKLLLNNARLLRITF